MRRSIIKRFFFTLPLMIFLCFVSLNLVALAEENLEWTIDIAQQLLAEGWEEYAQPGDIAVVGYAIHFVELEKSVARALGFGIQVETGKEEPGLWALAGGDYGIDLRREGAYQVTANLRSESGSQNEMVTLDSWLLTTEGNPLHVDIASKRLPSFANEYKEDRLGITILPTALLPNGMIESEVSLTYETISGTMAQLQTTALVGEQAEQPIAVVSREVNVGRRVEYQYFAVYLAGMQIPSELIPKDASVVPLGSIAGLQQFMETSSEKRWAAITLGVSYGDNRFGYLVDGSIPIGEKHRIYGELSSLPSVYLVGVEGALNQELHLLAEVGSLADGKVVLRLGLRDELQLDDLHLSAAVLPIRFTLDGPKPKLAVNWRIQADYSRENIGLSYKVDNDLERVRHDLGLVVFRNKPVGAKLSWSWDEVNRSVVTLGIEMRF